MNNKKQFKSETKNLTKSIRWNIWEYLYYRTTLFYSKHESKYGFEDNKSRGSYISGLLFSLNVESIIMLIITIFFKKNNFLVDYFGYIIVGVFLILILYSKHYFEKKKHLEIFEKFQTESNQQKRNRSILLISYIVSTIISLFVIVYLGNQYWN